MTPHEPARAPRSLRADRPIAVAIAGAYPVDPGMIRNGVEAVVVNLVEGLRRIPEIRLSVVSVTADVSNDTVSTLDGVTVHYLPSARRWRNISLDIVNRFRVGRKIRELGPDIVHVHNHATYPSMGLGPPLYPTVTTVHGIIREEVKYEGGSTHRIRSSSRRLLERIVLHNAQDVIAVSDYVRDVVQSMSRAHVTVIDNPVDDRFFRVGDTARHRGGSEVRPTILVVGALSRLKNPLDLISALDLVHRAGHWPELRLAGSAPDPAYYASLERCVREHSLEGHVRFLGQLTEDALAGEYERCTLVASASREETAGMVFQQAMAARLPVVGTAVGGVPFIVRQGVTGLLVPLGDVAAMAAALGALLEAPRLRAQLGEAGRRIALERYTPAIAAVRTVVVYEEILRRVASAAARPSP